MNPQVARGIAVDYFVARVNADPYHPPGQVTCGGASFDPSSRSWLVYCEFVVPPGQYYPGFSPDDALVKDGLAQPLPIPAGLYLSLTIGVDDATGNVV